MDASAFSSSPNRHPLPNLYLTGFMGTGKSAVGQKVAAQLHLPFLDSDKHIEATAHMSIPEIFRRHSEAYFRELERNFIFEQQPANGTVIACGGGMVTNREVLEKIQSMGVVVVLYAGRDTLLKRLAGDANRPLMQSDNPGETIERLIRERREVYKNAGVGIMTDGYTIHEVADHVIRIYLDKAHKN